MKYRRKIPKPIAFEAERWFSGEHPIVKPVVLDNESGSVICAKCGLIYNAHGYIQHREHGLLISETRVCPGDWIIPNPVPSMKDRYISRTPQEFEEEFEQVPTS